MSELFEEKAASELIKRHLREIFSSTDPAVRMRALSEIYAEDAVLFEPTGEVHGRQAISDTVGALLATLPPGFLFQASAPALGHHGLYVAPWRGGPADKPSMITGYDVIRFEGRQMKHVYVLIEGEPK